MSEKIKNYLGAVLIIVMLVFAFSAVYYVVNYSKIIDTSSFRSFSVSGEGKATAIPDIAEFNFSVITQGGKNISDLQKENTDKSNKIIEFLKSSGIEERDIKTENYNLEPRYQYFNCREGTVCPPPEITGYSITQSVSVKIRDFKKTGDILSGVVVNGANSVSQLMFTIDNIDSLQNKARSEAMSKAKEKARNISEAGGFRIGRLLSVEEGFAPLPPIFSKREAFGIGGGDMLSPEIQPGSQEVTVNVTLRYEIK